MAVTLTTGRKMLRQIVGGQGYTSTTPYLALSSTKPTQTGSSGSYNVTEPSAASYSRLKLGADNFTQDAQIDSQGLITIANTGEMHFHEVTEEGGWGEAIRYFAIFETETGTVPTYVGELDSYTVENVTAEDFDELKPYLYVRTGQGTSEDPYVYTKVVESDVFNPEATYCEKKLVVEKGTVPLIRPGYLKISIK